MKEYYLIPKEDIDKLEEARMNVWVILRNEDLLIRARFEDGVTSKIYSVTQRRYEVIEK